METEDALSGQIRGDAFELCGGNRRAQLRDGSLEIAEGLERDTEAGSRNRQ